jgi:hypothetical protein
MLAAVAAAAAVALTERLRKGGTVHRVASVIVSRSVLASSSSARKNASRAVLMRCVVTVVAVTVPRLLAGVLLPCIDLMRCLISVVR